jgi:hypothetical protein
MIIYKREVLVEIYFKKPRVHCLKSIAKCTHTCGRARVGLIEQHILDTNAEKTIVLNHHRCLINSGGEKMNYI